MSFATAFTDDNCEQECYVCHRTLKDIRKCRWVHRHVNGTLIAPGATTTEAESQGCFPVGNDCARRPEIAPFLLE